MHELSLVASIVESVVESLAAEPQQVRVLEVRLRVGVLTAVDEEALQFCYGMATEGTALEGSRLVVRRLPVLLSCRPCGQQVELPSVQSLRCPRCGTLGADLIQGRELEIEAIEIDDGVETVENNSAAGSDCKEKSR